MSTIPDTDELCSHIEALVQEHIAAIREAAMAAMQRAFSQSAPPPASTDRRRGKRTASTYRSAEEIGAVQEKIYNQVSATPGLGGAKLAEILGISTKEMHRPMAKLKKAGLVHSVGQRSETTYFPLAADVAKPS
jgi:predicted HTH transcriptional regulator